MAVKWSGRYVPTQPEFWDWYSADHAARELGTNKQIITWCIRSGLLTAIKVNNYPYRGTCWRIDPASVAALRRTREEA